MQTQIAADAPEWEAVNQTMWRLERRWHDGIPDATKHHAYEAFPPALFLPPLLALGSGHGRLFLDVGCGIGRNLCIAWVLGWRVAGIERHGPYVEAAAELIPEAEVTHGDAFDVDLFDADVVYLYRPMVTDDDEASLERHVIERMRPGSILYLAATIPPLPLEEVGPCLWRVP